MWLLVTYLVIGKLLLNYTFKVADGPKFEYASKDQDLYRKFNFYVKKDTDIV